MFVCDFVSQDLAQAETMAHSNEPLRQSAVTLPPVTAERYGTVTTANQEFEPNVTAVTAEPETILESQQNSEQPQTEEAISESQPTVDEVAQDLLACESSERLTAIRECYDRQILQEAAKLLNSQGNKEKVNQIEAWVKQSGLTGDNWEVYQQTGFTPEELAEIEQQAKRSDNPKTQQPKTAPVKKVGDWLQFYSSEGLTDGYVKLVEEAKRVYWVKVGKKDSKGIKVPFANLRK